MLTQKIASQIKSSLDGINEKKMYEKMSHHYQLLHLIDKNGKWATPELQKLSKVLLPLDMTEMKSKQFVDEMAFVAEKNPYLMNFLKQAEAQEFPYLANKVKTEGSKLFPDVVAYSSVLDRLTFVLSKEPKILEDCVKIFKSERRKIHAFNRMSLFHKVKLYSIEDPMIENIILKGNKTGEIPKDAGGLLVSINILEATFGDYFVMNHKDNGRAGWSLAVNKGGSKEFVPSTGAGPSKMAYDKSLSMNMPLPQKWDDLYQTWNMAFVSQMSNLPYIMPKLIIPQVARYQQDPSKYINNRAIALYLCANHLVFQGLENEKNKVPDLQWNDEKLTKLWGKVNVESAKEYESELRERKRNHITENNKSALPTFNVRKSNMPLLEKILTSKSSNLKNTKELSMNRS